MSQPSRALILTALVGLAGVVALSMMAKRYQSLMLGDNGGAGNDEARIVQRGDLPAPATAPRISPRPFPSSPEPPSDDELRDFIDVRSALKNAIAEGSYDLAPEHVEQAMGELMQLRRRVLGEHGVDPARYDAVRVVYLTWKREPEAVAQEVAATLEARRGDLEGADLGPYERLGL